jgi:hypothetical protein
MKRITRDRHLTPEEAAKYNKIRKQVEKEFPPAKKPIGLIPKTYNILTRAIEEGMNSGFRRAYKHTDAPNEEQIKENIMREIMNNICEVFSFDDEE